MKRGNLVLHSLLLFITATLLAVCPETVRAEEIPSAENTDGGSVSLNLIHYQAQSLTLSLDTPHLAFQDVTLNCTDAATGEPISISILADPGTSSYTLYDLETPLEELSGTLNISMITEPGYELDLDQTVFRIDGQTYTNGSTAVLHSSSASVTSSVTCSEVTLPEAPVEPETPVQPETPAEPESPAEPQAPTETPANPEVPAQSQTPVQEETTQATHTSSSGNTTTASETQSQTVSSGNSVAAEILETVPVAETQTADAQQQTTPGSNPGTASVSSATAAETIHEAVGQKPQQNASVTAETTSETSELHLADITRRLNLVLAVLLLVVLILLLTKLILTLKREKRHHRYRHYRFR